jgi:hypothetical protein
MAVTDYKFAGTAANVAGANADWANPDYAKADDTSYANVALEKNTVSDLLRLTNFGFTSSDIPSGATINGIEFIISRYCSAANYANDSALYLYDDGRVGNNLASATKWPSTIGDATYGGATNMCGTSLTQVDVVASTFGVELSVAEGDHGSGTIPSYVDYIKIRVYYTAGGGATVKPHYYYLQQ